MKCRIKKLRKEKGWTLRELSRRANVSYSTISKIENDITVNPRLNITIWIAKALGVPVSKLY
jgi:transcriptional regulator with XRE-family HTH domain